jgi:acetolactate synthase-1/2/3 large subunit
MEFDTAVRHGIPIIAIVGNDAAWGIDRQFQYAYYGRSVATDLRPTRYDRLVTELGGHGEHVERPEDLHGALERAWESGKPALVNVAIRSITSPLSEAMIERKRAQSRGG